IASAEIRVEELEEAGMSEEWVAQTCCSETHERRPLADFLYTVRDAKLHRHVLATHRFNASNQTNVAMRCMSEVQTEDGRNPFLKYCLIRATIGQAIDEPRPARTG